MRLETNRTLREASGLYRSAGYVEVEAFNDEPYAHHWFEKRLQGRSLQATPSLLRPGALRRRAACRGGWAPRGARRGQLANTRAADEPVGALPATVTRFDGHVPRTRSIASRSAFVTETAYFSSTETWRAT